MSLVRCDCGAWCAGEVSDRCPRCGEELPRALMRFRGQRDEVFIALTEGLAFQICEAARLKSDLADARLQLALRDRAYELAYSFEAPRLGLRDAREPAGP